MGKILVILDTAIPDMIDHRLPTDPIAALQIAHTEGIQEQLRLSKPGRVYRRAQYLHPGGHRFETSHRLGTGVAGPTVDDQMGSTRPSVGMQKAPHGRSKMRPVIAVETFGPHPSIIQRQPRQQVDRPVSVIFKFLPFDLPRPHQLGRRGPFEDLQIGLFVQSQDPFAALPQRLDALVIPQNFTARATASSSHTVVFQARTRCGFKSAACSTRQTVAA